MASNKSIKKMQHAGGMDTTGTKKSVNRSAIQSANEISNLIQKQYEKDWKERQLNMLNQNAPFYYFDPSSSRINLNTNKRTPMSKFKQGGSLRSKKK